MVLRENHYRGLWNSFLELLRGYMMRGLAESGISREVLVKHDLSTTSADRCFS
jgi:hypothetical protein